MVSGAAEEILTKCLPAPPLAGTEEEALGIDEDLGKAVDGASADREEAGSWSFFVFEMAKPNEMLRGLELPSSSFPGWASSNKSCRLTLSSSV
jgi:hypothetical protein